MEHNSGDLLLFQRIRQDDRLALNELFTTFYEKLCRFACTCSLSPQHAEEVVSDVFFNLWKNRARLDIHSNFSAYLYKAVRNAALAAKSVQPVADYSEAENIADTNEPVSLLEFEELRQQVDQAVNMLPQRCRQVFIMSRFEGMKYREISAVLGISERTIEHHIVKALDVIRVSVHHYPHDSVKRTAFTRA